MSTREYILNQVEMMRKECKKLHITPEEWVIRYAEKYHDEHVSEVALS
ncbi:MAG: hypothetical protein HYS07_07580 [Chlamydiae bacterium]|nr:hypothetical protein [Chlamydiota bacterium]MBI3277587.1 hypothetical protein [Chlamydiota bacterium]